MYTILHKINREDLKKRLKTFNGIYVALSSLIPIVGVCVTIAIIVRASKGISEIEESRQIKDQFLTLRFHPGYINLRR